MVFLFSMLGMESCQKEEENNNNEDVGTCDDGIKNQGEEGIDCGGPCPTCIYNEMTAKIDGDDWMAVSISYQNVPGNFWIEGNSSIAPVRIIKVVHKGNYETGTYVLDNATSYTDENGTSFTCVSGDLNITEWDTDINVFAGTFQFTATDGTNNVSITNGVINNCQYQLK